MSNDGYRVPERGAESGESQPVVSNGISFYRHAKRAVIALIGGTVVLIGIALLVLPGPGVLVIGLGFGVLAIEFAFARRWLKKAKEKAKDAKDWVQRKRSPATEHDCIPDP